jgi:hypothetical protein
MKPVFSLVSRTNPFSEDRYGWMPCNITASHSARHGHREHKPVAPAPWLTTSGPASCLSSTRTTSGGCALAFPDRCATTPLPKSTTTGTSRTTPPSTRKTPGTPLAGHHLTGDHFLLPERTQQESHGAAQSFGPRFQFTFLAGRPRGPIRSGCLEDDFIGEAI